MNRWALALLAALVGAAGQGIGQSLDLTQGGPIEITSTDGIEWRQQEQAIVARGNARAARDGVTIDSDRLIARYRPRAGAAAPTQGSASPASGSEIWRLEAEGRVRIASASERATGERAVYDLDQAVMVLSGSGLGLETPDQRITARESLEYWPQRRMAVARGGAVVTTSDDRRITADTLVAYFSEPEASATPAAPTGAQPAARPGAAGLPGGEGSKIDRVEAFGNVEIRTPDEVVRGERGLYSPPTGLARLIGGVRITRGDNQLNGQEAIVDLRGGVSRLISAPGQRVQGLIVPQQNQPNAVVVPGAGTPQGADRQPRQPRPNQAGSIPPAGSIR